MSKRVKKARFLSFFKLLVLMSSARGGFQEQKPTTRSLVASNVCKLYFYRNVEKHIEVLYGSHVAHGRNNRFFPFGENVLWHDINGLCYIISHLKIVA